MAGNARVDEGLRLIRVESERFWGELEGLGAADWDRPSNCPPWTIRQLVAHQIRGAENYLSTVERAFRGEPGQPEPREARTARMNEIGAQEPAAILADFRAITGRFEHEFGGLSPAQLEVRGTHSHGPRSAAWFVEQRLAEVAFHRWDFQASLGRRADLDRGTAGFLLPMLLEVNFPAIVARDGKGGRGSFRLAVSGEQGPAWGLEFAPGGVSVTRDGRPAVGPTIEADAAALALLVYGRQSLADLERAGRLSVHGDRQAAERFPELFGGP